MRLFLLPLFTVIIVNIFVDYVIFRRIGFKSILAKIGNYLHLSIALIALALILLLIFAPQLSIFTNMQGAMLVLYSYFCIYVPKYLFLIVASLANLIFRKKHRKASTIVAGFIALATCCYMVYSSAVTRNTLQVNEIDLYFDDLPKSFNGFRFTQISDIHLGGFGSDTTLIAKMVDRINEINADAIFFTGDLVNTSSKEVEPFISTLSRLKAPYGVFSIFGNHDYSDYGRWENKEAKINNHKLLNTYESQIGWQLLNNSHTTFRHAGDSIIVIGVENIGEPPFKTYGDLKKAYPNLNDNNFKILLSHNPTHWRREVLKSSNIHITLSGHTHAMQSVFSLFGKKFSLASRKYAEWGGLYSENGQHLYVNIGIGCVGIPARFGANPEITVFTIHKK